MNRVPIVSTRAGSCLTMQNYSDAGVTVIAYELSLLLFKPGMRVLSHYQSLAEYLGWFGKVVILIDLPAKNNQGLYCIISPFDGKKLMFDNVQLALWLQQLKGDPNLSEYKITDQPAFDGYQGIRYQQQSCFCEACSLGLKPDYLHFLLHSTPLLARRYLIQHNIFKKI